MSNPFTYLLYVIWARCCLFIDGFVVHCFLSCVLCFYLHHSPDIRMVTGWIPKLSKCIITYTRHFARVLTSETTLSGEMLGALIQCYTYFDTWRRWSADTSQLISITLTTTTSIITEILMSLILIGACTDLNVDSWSCSASKLNFWLWILLRQKIQTPAGVHPGNPVPWSSLIYRQNQRPSDV